MRKKIIIGKKAAFLLALSFAMTIMSVTSSIASEDISQIAVDYGGNNGKVSFQYHSNVGGKRFNRFSAIAGYSPRSFKRSRSYLSASPAQLSFFQRGSHILGDEDGRLNYYAEQVRLEEMSPIMTRMLLRNIIASIRPLKAVGEKVRPITTPLTFHKNQDGAISPSYFGNRAGISENSEPIFALSVMYTPANKLTLLVDFFEVVNVAYFKGNQLHINYMAPDASYNIGVFKKDLDKFFVEFGYNF